MIWNEITSLSRCVCGTSRARPVSCAHALVDDHVVEDADDGASVAVEVRDCERRHAGGGAARRRCRVRPQPTHQRPDAGVVRRHAVPRRTRAVTVVRPVAVRSEDPAVPADLAERHPQRVAAAARLAVASPTFGVLVGRTPMSPPPPPPPASVPRHDAQRRRKVRRRRSDHVDDSRQSHAPDAVLQLGVDHQAEVRRRVVGPRGDGARHVELLPRSVVARRRVDEPRVDESFAGAARQQLRDAETQSVAGPQAAASNSALEQSQRRRLHHRLRVAVRRRPQVHVETHVQSAAISSPPRTAVGIILCSHTHARTAVTFYRATLCYASTVYAVVVCPFLRPSVRPSVTSWYCIETTGRIELVLAWRLPSIYPTLCHMEIWVSPTIRVLRSGTLSKTPPGKVDRVVNNTGRRCRRRGC